MLNKLFLTSLLVFFDDSLQIPAGMIWCALYIWYIYHMFIPIVDDAPEDMFKCSMSVLNSFIFLVSPYVRRTDDRMQMFAQLEVFLLLLAGYVLREAGIADSFDRAMVL
jgi:hypothetical protein